MSTKETVESAGQLAKTFRFTLSSHFMPACALLFVAYQYLEPVQDLVSWFERRDAFLQSVVCVVGFASLVLVGSLLDGMTQLFVAHLQSTLWDDYQRVQRFGDKLSSDRLAWMNSMFGATRTFTAGLAMIGVATLLHGRGDAASTSIGEPPPPLQPYRDSGSPPPNLDALAVAILVCAFAVASIKHVFESMAARCSRDTDVPASTVAPNPASTVVSANNDPPNSPQMPPGGPSASTN